MKKLISFLLVLVLVLSLTSFSVFAVAGDASGDLSDFASYGQFNNNIGSISMPGTSTQSVNANYYTSNSTTDWFASILIIFPSPVQSGRVTGASGIISPGTMTGFRWRQFDSSGSSLSTGNYANSSGSFTVILSSGCKYLYLGFRFSSASSGIPPYIVTVNRSVIHYYQMVYQSDSSGGNYDPALDEEILSGLEAVASSLVSIEDGPYYAVSGVTVDQNGDLQHTLTQNASLEDLLNALGIAGTDSNHVIRGIYNNFGSYFTLYSIDDSTSSTTQIYRGLPQYVNALGQSLTDGINRLQRDNNLLYNSISSLSSSQSALNTTLQDALYEQTDSSPAENWSVAKWLKGIYDSISGFFTNFWSPAETDLKSAAEPGMQAAADNDLVASSSDVDSMSDIGNAFSSFASFPNVDPMEAVDILSDSDYYRFWTQETEDDLLRPDLLQSRGLKSFGSDVEYVDVLSDHLKELHSILGVNVDGK